MSEKIFADGLFFKAPRDGAPDFVKGSISVKTEDFTRFLEEHTKPDGWVNIDVKESRGGKLYCELNHYTRESEHHQHADEPPRIELVRNVALAFEAGLLLGFEGGD